MTGFWYLATPYSKYEDGLDAAYRLACEQAALVAKAGIPVYSPIAHTHGISTHGGIDPLAHEFWMKFDKPMMEAATGLIVLKADGWEQSHGMQMEMRFFDEAGKPVYFMAPGIVPASLRKTEA